MWRGENFWLCLTTASAVFASPVSAFFIIVAMSQLQNSVKERARQATAIHELQLELLRTEDGCIDTQQALTELEQCKTQLHQSVHSVIAQHKLYLSLSPF